MCLGYLLIVFGLGGFVCELIELNFGWKNSLNSHMQTLLEWSSLFYWMANLILLSCSIQVYAFAKI